jgi:PKHD-type hydroxylase
MLNLDATYSNYVDFLLINKNSSNEAQQFIWTKQECEKIIQMSNYLLGENGTLSNEKIDQSMRKVTRYRILNNENSAWIYEKIYKTIINANSFFWNYDIDFIETIELLKYNYDETSEVLDHYNKHSDFGPTMNKRKISYSATLSDASDYEGGDLVFFLEKDITMPKEQGQIVMFPSFQFHAVTEVKKGTRWSLVTWVSGRPFK